MEKIKIQLAAQPVVKDHLTIYQQPAEGVDLTMDLKALTYRPGTVEQIFTHHVLDHFFEEELLVALKNWYNCLAPGGRLYIVTDDFEYVCRAFVGGDITIDTLNKYHANPVFLNKEIIGRLLIKVGFPEPKVRIWFGEIKDFYHAQRFELIMEAQK
jgi:predicted SAM-dependent methyltransferase